MKKFLNKDFLLQTKTASTLFHKYAEKMPIYDFHNHLSAKEIFEDKQLGNLANAWLDGDHYKWRAMRAYGVPEEFITGHLNEKKQDDYQRFLFYVKTVQNSVGNPLYHWSHLELKRYFNIDKTISESNAEYIWNKCNELLSTKEYSVRNLLRMQNVKYLCTTDDPIDSLEYHKKLAQDFEIKVLPSFRPDGAFLIENEGFVDYIKKLGEVSSVEIKSLSDLIDALSRRIEYFKSVGSLVSDISLENDFFEEADDSEIEKIFVKRLKGKELTKSEICQFKTYLLCELGKLYSKNSMVMQIHIGALRDNNSSLYNTIGKNVGGDSLQDFNYAIQLGKLLDKINSVSLPKTIIYNLNPKDNEMIATMCSNFRDCQFGPAWWFNDHKDGIENQLKVYSRTGVLAKNIGMLTDSRSFLSFPRHEYYRRILCNYVGNLVENGEYPNDEQFLGIMIENISYLNALKFFNE
ncbi:MAG: glucuronate isomerase [Treponema sp.]|jgi:glucuronate isomerase|nr:glucuronate isomerase [Treponema sp.]